jgi:Family of unknown function (DUF7002)
MLTAAWSASVNTQTPSASPRRSQSEQARGVVLRRTELERLHPRLYHVAEAGAWPAIRRHGLLSTSALLDRFEVPRVERRALESRRRRDAVRLKHPQHGVAVVRDNKPIRPELLVACLADLSVADWFRTLNGRVFFWADRERASRLVGARANRRRPHDVLVVDTQALLARYGDRIRVASINTGAVLFPRAPKRGRATFRAVHEHDPALPVVELTVEHAVLDIEAVTISVERWRVGCAPALIWSAPTADA